MLGGLGLQVTGKHFFCLFVLHSQNLIYITFSKQVLIVIIFQGVTVTVIIK